MSSNLRKQALLFTELRLSQGTLSSTVFVCFFCCNHRKQFFDSVFCSFIALLLFVIFNILFLFTADSAY